MANHFSLQLLLLTTLITAANLQLISAAETPPPPQLPSRPPTPTPSKPRPPPSPKPSKRRHEHSHRHRKAPHPPPAPSSKTPPPPPPEIQENPLKSIFDFAGWDKAITSADLSSVPLAATFFVPSSNSTGGGGGDFSPFHILYHIVPQRLTFSELQKLPPKARLPTLLPNKYIVVTDNSPSNFSVDDSRITRPDSYSNAAFVLHGVGKILDYSVYGGGGVGGGVVLPPPENATSPSSRRPLRKNPNYPREMTSGGQKCYPSNGILMVFLALGCVCVSRIVFH